MRKKNPSPYPRFGGTEGGSLFDGKLPDEHTHDFIRISCRLQRTPLCHLGKLQTVQGVNDVVDTFGRANDEDFDEFSV